MATHRTPLLFGISDGYLSDLGRVVAAWTHIEDSFFTLFLSLVVMRGASSGKLRDPRVQQLMGSDLKSQVHEFKKRLKELELPEETVRKATCAMDKLVSLRNERDHIAHSVFTASVKRGENGISYSDNEAMGRYISWKKLFAGHEWEPVSREELKKIAERIEDLFWELLDLSLDGHLRAQTPRKP